MSTPSSSALVLDVSVNSSQLRSVTYCMLRMANHVHDQDSLIMKPLNHLRWPYTNSTDKQLGTAVNDDVPQLVQLSTSVVMVGLTRIASDLRQGEINTKG